MDYCSNSSNNPIIAPQSDKDASEQPIMEETATNTVSTSNEKVSTETNEGTHTLASRTAHAEDAITETTLGYEAMSPNSESVQPNVTPNSHKDNPQRRPELVSVS
jgi:hypothetical protein